jgi:hypothetical protein
MFLKWSPLVVIGLLTSTSPLAQVPGDPDPELGTVTTRNVRLLPPEVSRSLKIARTPLPPTAQLLVGTYWSCHREHGFDICRIKLVVCTPDQSQCVEA